MYAQIVRSLGNLVTLIGDTEVGLPIEDSDVICIDIGDRADVLTGMKFNEETQIFNHEGETQVAPIEQREKAYETLRYRLDETELLFWDSSALTVDEGNKICLNYLAEGNTEQVAAIQVLISEAKAYIRGLYPEEAQQDE